MKNYYEACNIVANWFIVLTKDSEQSSFSQSNINPCLFTRNNYIAINYVNDYLAFYENKYVLEELVLLLKDEFKLTNKSDLATFLGVNINKIEHNTLKLIQPYLTECVIKVIYLNRDIKIHNILANKTLFCNKSTLKCI